MTDRLYGIKNCDTVKKARKWLEAKGQQVTFVDFREQELSQDTLKAWVEHIGWEAVLNKRSTSFRALDDADKQDIDSAKAISLMLANPTLIKRPVLTRGQDVMTGFKEADYQAWFGL
ncbi:ArsC family reductase [Shewanella algae]|uniref:ArsC family reductase n=1 Tax=Shewanella algae TaxID=38313 RepID=UPI0021C21805|nr:ArsC family reductase [Shewanella algae]MCT8979393.1 ArsC family reductase [Shewanella algae]